MHSCYDREFPDNTFNIFDRIKSKRAENFIIKVFVAIDGLKIRSVFVAVARRSLLSHF